MNAEVRLDIGTSSYTVTDRNTQGVIGVILPVRPQSKDAAANWEVQYGDLTIGNRATLVDALIFMGEYHEKVKEVSE
jgi:hypothetical protein